GLYRFLTLGLAAGLFGLAAVLGSRSSGSLTHALAPTPPRKADFLPERNRVNLTARNLPTEWDVKKGTNIRWSAEVGSRAYGGPVVAGGKVFVGTNNDNPRDPAIKGDRGVLMCFDEKTGKFLWQLVFDKLPTGQVNDWPGEGIASGPVVEGD